MNALIWIVLVIAIIFFIIGGSVKAVSFLLWIAPILLVIAVVVFILNRSRGVALQETADGFGDLEATAGGAGSESSPVRAAGGPPTTQGSHHGSSISPCCRDPVVHRCLTVQPWRGPHQYPLRRSETARGLAAHDRIPGFRAVRRGRDRLGETAPQALAGPSEPSPMISCRPRVGCWSRPGKSTLRWGVEPGSRQYRCVSVRVRRLPRG